MRPAPNPPGPDGGTYRVLRGEGSDDGEFYYPRDVAVDADGNVYVTDSLNDRVQKFQPSAP